MYDVIHTINITCPPLMDGQYSVISLNRFPIIYIDDNDADGILGDEEFVRIVKKYVKSDRIYESGEVCVRTLKNGEIVDNAYKIKEIYTK